MIKRHEVSQAVSIKCDIEHQLPNMEEIKICFFI
ncbi:hypothetical protein PO124_07055 [Bacillus licheniformis]|nr:hypothetical protein [Bacillus licheniformis]